MKYYEGAIATMIMSYICFILYFACLVGNMPCPEYWLICQIIMAILTAIFGICYLKRKPKGFQYIGDDEENKEIDY